MNRVGTAINFADEEPEARKGVFSAVTHTKWQSQEAEEQPNFPWGTDFFSIMCCLFHIAHSSSTLLSSSN